MRETSFEQERYKVLGTWQSLPSTGAHETNFTAHTRRTCRIVCRLNIALTILFVVIVSKTSYYNTNYHLRNLRNGNDFGIHPLWLAFNRHQKVVAVPIERRGN